MDTHGTPAFRNEADEDARLAEWQEHRCARISSPADVSRRGSTARWKGSARALEFVVVFERRNKPSVLLVLLRQLCLARAPVLEV